MVWIGLLLYLVIQNFKPWHTILNFNDPESLLKTKEEMLLSGNFSCSHNVFNPIIGKSWGVQSIFELLSVNDSNLKG